MLDVSRLVWRRWAWRLPTGIDRVCLAYLEHYRGDARAVVQHPRFRRILSAAGSRRLFALLADPPPDFRRQFLLAMAREVGRVPGRGAGRLYLNVGHTGLDRPGLSGWLARTGVRPIFMVHDLIPLSHPQFCRAGEAERHAGRMRTVLTTGAGVIANSQATLDELRRFAAAQRLRMPPALVAWLGATALPGPPFAPAPVPERPTFVMLGTIEARKNHRMMLDIWWRIVARLNDDAPRLLIVGQRGWEADDVHARLDDDRRLRGHVVELDHVTDEELAEHLSSARALLFPSEVEGFGLPLIEALGRGVPAIASDIPVFREVGQQVPLLIPAGDADRWQAAILDFAAPDSAERAAQLRRLERFRPPTWAEHFAAVDAWLDTLEAIDH